jgi:hypothetical protein
MNRRAFIALQFMPVCVMPLLSWMRASSPKWNCV